MPRLRGGTPLWLAQLAPADRPRFPSLSRNDAADVVVIGGGMNGAGVAWRFADAGLRVIVLEANRIGSGSTAASTALLMQEPDEDLSDLAQRYGAARGRIWELIRRATHELVATLQRLEIRCELTRSDSVYYALSAEHARRLHAGRSPDLELFAFTRAPSGRPRGSSSRRPRSRR